MHGVKGMCIKGPLYGDVYVMVSLLYELFRLYSQNLYINTQTASHGGGNHLLVSAEYVIMNNFCSCKDVS